jgi:hypothetical protein
MRYRGGGIGHRSTRRAFEDVAEPPTDTDDEESVISVDEEMSDMPELDDLRFPAADEDEEGPDEPDGFTDGEDDEESEDDDEMTSGVGLGRVLDDDEGAGEVQDVDKAHELEDLEGYAAL